jgi:hypothetical protein
MLVVAAYQNLAEVLTRLGKTDQAAEAKRKAKELSDKAKSFPGGGRRFRPGR